MALNYSKLLGRIVEKYRTQALFANAMGISEHTISQKLNNRKRFSQSEIMQACKVLDIPIEEIGAYFFTREVQ